MTTTLFPGRPWHKPLARPRGLISFWWRAVRHGELPMQELHAPNKTSHATLHYALCGSGCSHCTTAAHVTRTRNVLVFQYNV